MAGLCPHRPCPLGAPVTDLSPAARAIVAAFNDRHELCGPFDDDWQELCLAAALRELAGRINGADGIRQQRDLLLRLIREA